MWGKGGKRWRVAAPPPQPCGARSAPCPATDSRSCARREGAAKVASTARGAGAALRPTLGSRGCRVFNLGRGDKASARPVLCSGCPLEGASAEEEGRLSPGLVPYTDRAREAWTPPTAFLMQELKRTCSWFAPRGHSAQKQDVGHSSGLKKKKKRKKGTVRREMLIGLGSWI